MTKSPPAAPDSDRASRAPLPEVRSWRTRYLFKNELRLRLVSAGIMIPIALASTWAGGVFFVALVLLCGALVLFEWLRMIGASNRRYLQVCGFGLLVAAAAAGQWLALWQAALAVAGASAALGLIAWRDRPAIAGRWVLAGGLYTGLAVVAAVALRKGDAGFAAVVFVLLIAWSSDTAAFFVGRRLRGPKLWPRVSPSKTWSGALGGFAAALIVGPLVVRLFGGPLNGVTVVVAGLLAVSAQLGDLAESAVKRFFMIKDAGSLIPGHGGVMDRVDGIVAAALVACLAGGVRIDDAPAEGLFALMGG